MTSKLANPGISHTGGKWLDYPFWVDWQESTAWKNDWACRPFAKLEDAKEWYKELSQREGHIVWLCEYGYAEEANSEKRPGTFYFQTNSKGPQSKGLERGLGISWYDEFESTAPVAYEPASQ